MSELWIVSGFMRSGTSMMMRCLESGGMDAAYNEDIDERFRERMGSEGYDPNFYGFRELGKELLDAPEFPEAYVGRLVKCLASERLRRLPGDLGIDYKVLFMVRDPNEIWESVLRVKGGRMPKKIGEALIEYNKNVTRYFYGLDFRTDTEVALVNYNKVVADPLGEFEKIKGYGWPIDPAKAAECVDLAQYRHRAK